jgi:hypothetical protein
MTTMIIKLLVIFLVMNSCFKNTCSLKSPSNHELLQSGIKINCAFHYLGKSQFKIDKKRIDIEVFKYASNNEILAKNNTAEFHKLRWLSMGYPRMAGSHKTRFTFHPDGFFIEMETLPYEQKKLMIDSVSKTFGINATESQFLNFPSSLLGQIECSFVFTDEHETAFFNGQVRNVYKYPFRVEFDAKFGTRRRVILQNKIEKEADKIDIMFSCHIRSSTEISKQKSLVLTDEEIARLGIIKNLFESNNERVYVTRYQVKALAYSLYARLNIQNDFGLDLRTFVESFADDLLAQTAEDLNHYRKFSEIIKEMSPFFMKLNYSLSTVLDFQKQNFQLNQMSSWLGYENVKWRYLPNGLLMPERVKVSRLLRVNLLGSISFASVSKKVSEPLFQKYFNLFTQQSFVDMYKCFSFKYV